MKLGFRKGRVLLLVASLSFMGLAACGGGGGNSRTIEVDYQDDDAAALFLGYFPRKVTVTPGMTVKFHQTWTGEPHSVTMGTIADEGVKPLRKLLDGYLDGSIPIPDEPPKEYDSEVWDEKLPAMFSDGDGLGQAASFPCYVDKESDLPLDNVKNACDKKFQKQPEFNGKQAYYSSGFIPFEGELANEFELKIAEDTPDGDYFYYCNVHGVLMSGDITVKKGAKVESQGSLNRRGREEAQRMIAPAKKVWEKEKAGEGAFPLPLAGSGDETTEQYEAGINEFTPRTINAKVGEKVTWTFIGDHTISFNVPAYTPLFVFGKDGVFGFNEGLDKAKEWPGAPEREEPDGPPPADYVPPPPASVDAGEWDGSGGLHSSGTGWETGDRYSVTFTKAGTYPYACLIHPGQIGKVVVK